MDMDYPRIILLNGASSSGKTTLAKELLKKLGAPYFYYSSDHLVDSGMLAEVDRVNKDTDRSWNVLRPKFFDGFHRSIAAFAEAGLYLLVEHIVEYPEWLEDLVGFLNPFDVLYVGVYCPADEIDRRERRRGDRTIGEGRQHLDDGIHTWSGYDLTVDTFTHSTDENVDVILFHIESLCERETVFEKLYRKRILKKTE